MASVPAPAPAPACSAISAVMATPVIMSASSLLVADMGLQCCLWEGSEIALEMGWMGWLRGQFGVGAERAPVMGGGW